MDHNYSPHHIRFLQVLLDKYIVTKQEGNSIIEMICQTYNVPFDPTKISTFIKVINSQIANYNMKIREGKREDDGSPMYILVSLVCSDLNKLIIGGNFTLPQVKFFERLVDLVVCNNNPDEMGLVSSVDALNLVDGIDNKMTKSAASDFLNSLTKMEFIHINQDGMISLTLRTILELEQYLVDQYNDVVAVCKMCSVIVISGKMCNSCSTRFHSYCAVKFLKTFEAKNAIPKCLSCGIAWPERLINGVRQLYSSCYHHHVSPELSNQSGFSGQGDARLSQSSRKRKH